MTRKDFQLIAASVHRSGVAKSIDKNKVRREAAESMRRLIAIDLAANLANTNPLFDEARFMEACGF